MSNDSGFWDDAPVVFKYTRAQAIEDGVLIDVTENARKAGLRWHTVITPGVFAAIGGYVGPNEGDVGTMGDLDALMRAVVEVARTAKGDRVHFDFMPLDRGYVSVWAHIGPGDDATPVMTVMLQGED